MIDNNDIERLKELFVTKDDCNEITGVSKERIFTIEQKQAVIIAHQKIELAILSAVGLGVLGLVLAQMWGV